MRRLMVDEEPFRAGRARRFTGIEKPTTDTAEGAKVRDDDKEADGRNAEQ